MLLMIMGWYDKLANCSARSDYCHASRRHLHSSMQNKVVPTELEAIAAALMIFMK